MKVEINVAVDLVNDNDKLIKKNIIIKHYIDTDDMRTPQEIFNSRGNIQKKRCKVFIKDIGPVIVEHSYNEIKSLIEDKRIVIKGFRNEESKRRSSK